MTIDQLIVELQRLKEVGVVQGTEKVFTTSGELQHIYPVICATWKISVVNLVSINDTYWRKKVEQCN